jgi:hypothetical protein
VPTDGERADSLDGTVEHAPSVAATMSDAKHARNNFIRARYPRVLDGVSCL